MHLICTGGKKKKENAWVWEKTQTNNQTVQKALEEK